MDVKDTDDVGERTETAQSRWSKFNLVDMKLLKTFLKALKETGGSEEGLTTQIIKDSVEVTANGFLDVINSSLSEVVVPEL